MFLALGLAIVFVVALAAKARSLGDLARDTGLAGTLILALNVPFVIPYYDVRGSAGLTRVIEDAEGYAPSPGAWLQAPTQTQEALISAVPALASSAAEANAALFPGFIFLGLAIAGAIATLRSNASSTTTAAVRAVLAVAVVSLWLSLGPGFGLYRIFFAAIPGFDLIRVPSRFFLLALTAFAPLGALGLDRVRRPALAWALMALALIECVPVPSAAAHDPIVTPPIDAWLAGQPKPFRVVELPVPQTGNSVRQARFHSEFMIHGAAHWQPMINGYSSVVPPVSEAIFAELREFPTDVSIARLESLGVRYVIVHTDMYQPDRWAEKERALAPFADRVRLVRVEGEGRAYAIGALP